MITRDDLERHTEKLPNSENKRFRVKGLQVTTPGDVKVILDYLQSNSKITSVNLSGIALKDEGAIVLSTLPLTEITVTACGIGPKGAAALATMPGLDTLTISGNRIKSEGAIALSASLSLRRLIASGCDINDHGAAALAQVQSFDLLNIRNNPTGRGMLDFLSNNSPFARQIVSEATDDHFKGWQMSKEDITTFKAAQQANNPLQWSHLASFGSKNREAHSLLAHSMFKIDKALVDSTEPLDSTEQQAIKPKNDQ